METRDFFISYTREDLDWAKQVVEILERNGYTTYCQYKDSPPGEDFIDWINEAIRVSRNFIVIWSNAANASDYCKEECKIAYDRKIKKQIGLLLPLYINDAPSYSVIERYTHINLYGLNPGETEKRLLWGVRSVQPSKSAQKSDNQPSKDVQKIDDGTKYFDMGKKSYEAGDYQKAREYWEQAADLGNADALNRLGILYRNGYGVEQDYEIARQCYEKAADWGNADALVSLGFLYHYGYGVEQDYEIARQYYEKAITKGTEAGDENAVKVATFYLKHLFQKLKRE